MLRPERERERPGMLRPCGLHDVPKTFRCAQVVQLLWHQAGSNVGDPVAGEAACGTHCANANWCAHVGAAAVPCSRQHYWQANGWRSNLQATQCAKNNQCAPVVQLLFTIHSPMSATRPSPYFCTSKPSPGPPYSQHNKCPQVLVHCYPIAAPICVECAWWSSVSPGYICAWSGGSMLAAGLGAYILPDTIGPGDCLCCFP